MDLDTLQRLLDQNRGHSGVHTADDEIDLLELWQGLMARKWLIMGLTFLVTFVSAVVAINMTPQYESSVLIAPAGGEGGNDLMAKYGGLASMAGISLPGGEGGVSKVAEAKAILKSHRFLSAFVERHQLKPILFEKQWDAATEAWQTPEEPGLVSQAKTTLIDWLRAGEEPEKATPAKDPTLAPGEPSMQKAVNLFKNQITLSDDKETGMLTVTVEWQDPELAQAWASKLVQSVDQLLRQKAMTESREVIDYLQDQLETIRLTDIRDMALKMIEEEMKQLTFARVKPEYVFKVLDPAIVPEEPTKPKKPLIVAVGFVLGGMLSVFLALILNVRRNRQTNHADAQA
ncbi:MAG: Wzz/FepE/Etk N-terminal domain-containing protein [Hydrogenovibrio sp.]|uniref:Wzz/FepE/Etk N-terminal domain-containing protein n=1 Tax=Hydrogenovibrio sp. TaxID=2065821 RepID=UPI0028708451|nr:Wzz/FepE/Etk N-terminal domain-containing protein [Hydrogenovibrio sp.]MDR9499880.1 Wzz/FepE/Etk N-terminal domain-containing protein [Hydrogenovibrio sp.]